MDVEWLFLSTYPILVSDRLFEYLPALFMTISPCDFRTQSKIRPWEGKVPLYTAVVQLTGPVAILSFRIMCHHLAALHISSSHPPTRK